VAEDGNLIRPAHERIEDIINEAAAQIAQIMKTSGGGVTVGWFFLAKIWELSQEQLDAIAAGGPEPAPSAKFMTNVNADMQLDFLAETAEWVASKTEEDEAHRLN